MRIAFGCDHAATEMKNDLMAHAQALGHTVFDCGVAPGEKGDYPEYAAKTAKKVQSGECERGIVVCGTGIGVAITCNKFHGIRCAQLSDCFSAKMSRAHNDANMAAFGARVIGIELAKMMLEFFLDTPFEGGRHARRVDLIMKADAGESIENP